MHFVKGQKVSVLNKDQVILVDIIADITACGDIELASGSVFDRCGRGKKNNFWDQTFLEEYQEGDEDKIYG